MKCVIIIAFALALGLLLAYPTMWLINSVFAPSLLMTVFGVSKIAFWQTYALMVLLGMFRSSVTGSSKD